MCGHFSAMQRQLKRNEAAKAARRDAARRKRRDLLGSKANSTIKKFDFPKVSKKELTKIKKSIRENIKKDKKRNLVFLITLSLIASVIVFRSINFKVAQDIQIEAINEDNYLSEHINEYSYLLNDGDQWVEKGNWHNAIYRYEQAVQLFPNEYEANYRLALAYSYNCQFKNKTCNLGEKLTGKLLKYHPDEINLIKLKVAFQDYARKRLTNNY